MKITGILSISNGAGLEYPYPPVVLSLSQLCDNVIVGVDPSFPTDAAVIASLGLSNVHTVDSPWNQDNRSEGTEIALQMDRLVEIAKGEGSDWVVVLQADELFHEKDHSILRIFMERADQRTTGFRTTRIYFWKDLETIRSDWSAELVRVFRPGSYSFMAENTDKAGMFSAQVLPGDEIKLPFSIYHYSRVDSPEVISRRVRNLDGFFHQESALIPVDELPPYDFIPRAYDNFSIDGPPERVKAEFVLYSGSHPFGIKEWYE